MRRLLLLGVLVAIFCQPSLARTEPTYRVAWTIYAGSVPLVYADQTGLLDEWADRYGIDIEAVQINDYIEAVTQFSLGQFDAVICMSLDALTIPAASGMDTSVIAPLSTSAGSDGLIMRGDDSQLIDLKGKQINLVALSGSHYLLARALDSVGLAEPDVTVINTSDADIGAVMEDSSAQAVVTWKPQLTTILDQYDNTHLVYDSSDIYGEIIDVVIAPTDKLDEHPEFAMALAGAWFEATAALDPAHPGHQRLLEIAADTLSTDIDSVRSQLATIDFFTPTQAIDLIQSEDFDATQRRIAEFAFKHGLLGDGLPSADFIGIENGRGDIIGNADNVRLRFRKQWLSDASEESAP
jgi:NitT/TauT family transport system substrate-binding protein